MKRIAACEPSIHAIFALLPVPVFSVVTMMRFVSYIVGEGESLFVLAQITATFGVLVLVGSFVQRERASNLNRQILLVAKSFFISTIGFESVGMLFTGSSMLELKTLSLYLLLTLNLVSNTLAFGGFAMVISGLLMIFPKLEIGYGLDENVES
jgi:hypothetical protein